MFNIVIFAVWVFAGAALIFGLCHIFSDSPKRSPSDPESLSWTVAQDTSSPPPYSPTSTSTLTTQTKSDTTRYTITATSRRERTSAFRANRLTSSTFLIVETDDIFSEHPYIYVKLVPSANTILIVDTGCGGASTKNVDITSLREFIETVPFDGNGGRPLNDGGRMGYVVALTHCHYDHIREIDTSCIACKTDSNILWSSRCRAIRP